MSTLEMVIAVFGVLATAGGVKFFVSYGTRLTMVEKESAENKAKLDKHANELIQANTQISLIAAALESIKCNLAELKADVKDWMQRHSGAD
jgi:hypothetical protein